MADTTEQTTPKTQKVMGWGRDTVKEEASSTKYDDIVEDSTSLDIEEGEEIEATIEGGSAEGRKHAPDKYILTFKRRLGSKDEAKPGYTEDAGDIDVFPENTGAIGVQLKNVSRHVALKMDTKDGLVGAYTYKTKGATNAKGELTDIVPFVKGGADAPTL